MSKETLFKKYLQKDTVDYAIMINGEWGIGKTYYYEKHLKQIISDEGKKAIKISLYGKENVPSIVDEITYAILQEYIVANITKIEKEEKKETIVERFNSKFKGVPGAIGNKLLGKGFEIINDKLKSNLGIESIFDICEYINDTVLVFDDFERCKINIVELLGFISEFLEKGNLKIIVLANEKEITSVQNIDKLEERYNFGLNLHKIEKDMIEGTDQENKGNKNTVVSIDNEYLNEKIHKFFGISDQYIKMKEKVFGYTITIKSNVDNIYDELINEYKRDEDIYRILINNKKFILDVYSCIDSNNLRILKRSFDVIENIFNELKATLNEVESDEIKLKLERYIISFSIIFYHIDKLNLVDINKNIIDYSTSKLGFSYGNSDEYFSYMYHKFVEPLKSTTDIIHIKSIVDFIINGELDGRELIQDISICKLKLDEDIENLQTKNEYDVAEKILRFDTLEEKEFNENLIEFIKNIENGIYITHCYKKIIQVMLMLNYNGLLDKEIDEIVTLIKNGIDKSNIEGKKIYSHSEFNYGLNPEIVSEINTYANQRIYEIDDNIKTSSLKIVLSKLKIDFNSGIDMLNEQYIDVGNLFFAKLKIDEFVNILNKLDNNQISQIYYFIRRKYNFTNLGEFYSDELTNLMEFVELLDKLEVNDKIKKFNVNRLIEESNRILEDIKKSI